MASSSRYVQLAVKSSSLLFPFHTILPFPKFHEVHVFAQQAVPVPSRTVRHAFGKLMLQSNGPWKKRRSSVNEVDERPVVS
jgi:hypothetical protein